MILSEFQKNAIEAIEAGHHVLITAHTGSGKTLPAEHAIKYFTSKGKNVIYTSPIKALSNQKFNEFTNKFPSLSVGIFTGDNKHNPKANVLIMTTEILQNKLLNPSASHLDFDLNDLGCVIFDEVHYIDDEERGTVWEQSIILLPKEVQIVMLSATIGDKEQFAGWIERIKEKKVVICSTNNRVVPLVYYQYFATHQKAIELAKPPFKALLESKNDTLVRITDQGIEQNKKCLTYLTNQNIRVSRKQVLNQLCFTLREKEMFPCLCFVFSRKQVEEMAKEITTPLFEAGEKDYEIEPICRQLLVSRVKNWKEYVMLPEYNFYLDLLHKGIGIHHAGMLPIFREMIEILYDKKYIQLLFATETFAIGLNMPTKTVCFSSLYKHDGYSQRLLHPHEFIQMSGRAGRRNIDTIGHVILLTNLFDPPETSAYNKLLNSGPKILKSKFKISYSLLLHNTNKEELIEFANKSLMSKDIINQITYCENRIRECEKEIEKETENSINKEVCIAYKSYKDQLPFLKNSKKSQIYNLVKKIEMDVPNIQKQMETFERILNLEKEVETNRVNKEYAEQYISTQINNIHQILNENGFFEEKNIAKSINEIHPLVFTDILTHLDWFDKYSTAEIFSILSCFYDVKVQDDYKLFKPVLLKEEIKYINDRIYYYMDKENQYGLSSYTQECIQYDMMEYVQGWMNCADESSSLSLLERLKKEKNVFSGDFIKCCLKLVNVAREIDSFSDLHLGLRQKLREGSDLLLKFICTNESLYL